MSRAWAKPRADSVARHQPHGRLALRRREVLEHQPVPVDVGMDVEPHPALVRLGVEHDFRRCVGSSVARKCCAASRIGAVVTPVARSGNRPGRTLPSEEIPTSGLARAAAAASNTDCRNGGSPGASCARTSKAGHASRTRSNPSSLAFLPFVPDTRSCLPGCKRRAPATDHTPGRCALSTRLDRPGAPRPAGARRSSTDRRPAADYNGVAGERGSGISDEGGCYMKLRHIVCAGVLVAVARIRQGWFRPRSRSAASRWESASTRTIRRRCRQAFRRDPGAEVRRHAEREAVRQPARWATTPP